MEIFVHGELLYLWKSVQMFRFPVQVFSYLVFKSAEICSNGIRVEKYTEFDEDGFPVDIRKESFQGGIALNNVEALGVRVTISSSAPDIGRSVATMVFHGGKIMPEGLQARTSLLTTEINNRKITIIEK